MTEASVQEQIDDDVKIHGYEWLKGEQLVAVEQFVSSKDVFVSLDLAIRLSTVFCQPYMIGYEGTQCQRRWL